MKVLEKVLRVGDTRTLKKLGNYANAVDALEGEFKKLSDEELKAETESLKERYQKGETLDELLPEAFAAVREAADRTLGMRHFRVQVMGGANLHMGNISEMKTGEGKTLVATLPAYLNALTGKGVHIVTVNDYLAEYQSKLMGRIFRFLGISCGCILSSMTPDERLAEYNCDITYGTNNEFGFDYLRDNMAWSQDELVQRGHNFAIVDEVDSILIDESRTPLIISGPASGDANRWYVEFARIVKRLKINEHYEVDEKKKTVGLLDSGIDKVEDYLGINNLYDVQNTPLIGFINNAIKAKELFKRDKDYVVQNSEVMIVDEHTGRILEGRRYNDGVHQAIEAKENVEIQPENQTMATITLQNYFRLYDKLSGMTGTAETEAAEFMSTYKIGVVPIPTNKPMQRIDNSDLIYKNEIVKFDAVVEDIVERHEKGQPILVGTTSVEKSEYLSAKLREVGVKHEVLNAKFHEHEASIVAQAGRKGAVTVATNMAGRGTDIMLGGNDEHIAVDKMKAAGLDPVQTPEQYEELWPDALAKAKEQVKAEHDEVIKLGGLYVLGTERHESRRIDNQLRGRAGRQGDPGESRFYLSMTDDLMRMFNPAMGERIMNSSLPDDVPIESKMVSKAIMSAQNQVESTHAEQRKNILKYDDVMNRQREAIYSDRRQILKGDNLKKKVENFFEDVITDKVDEYAHDKGTGETWDLPQLWSDMREIYPVNISIDEVEEAAQGKANLTADFITRELISDAKVQYQKKEDQLGPGLRDVERQTLLSIIGEKWQEHLYEMDYLKEGIGLRAMAQRDPLVEYQREGYALFNMMMDNIRLETVKSLFKVDTAPGQQAQVQLNFDGQSLHYLAPNEEGEATAQEQPGRRLS
ncbi:MAG: preprotein translocase subunit SecA [Micrococcaceae bacterium]